VSHRRKSLIGALAHRLSVEAHRLSLLSTNLHALRKALDRLTREVLILLAILIGIAHLVFDMLWRLISAWR
jgi:vacuolar-type H+-ATPase subunit I/STV1